MNEKIANNKDGLKKGQKLAENAVVLEGLLVAAKTIVGLLSGSTALISDAIHSASDILSIITSWLGLKIAQKKSSEHFPYGFYKAENLGALVISVLVLYASWEMARQGYQRLFTFSEIKLPFLAALVSLLDAVILFFFGNYETKIGKSINARSIIAMGEENRMHIFSSTAVLVGTLAAFYQIPLVEGAITIFISLLILKIGIETARDSIFTLMDVSPGEDVINTVSQVIENSAGVEEYYDLKLRKAGPFVFGETKIGIRKFIDVNRAHEIADRIEQEIKSRVSEVDSFTVHVEPYKSDFFHIVIPVKIDKGLDSILNEKFSRSPYLLFANVKNGKIIGHYVIENPYKNQKLRSGLAVAKLIIKQKSDVLITKDIGEISFFALKDYLVDVYQADNQLSAQELIGLFIDSKLSQITSPTKKSDNL